LKTIFTECYYSIE